MTKKPLYNPLINTPSWDTYVKENFKDKNGYLNQCDALFYNIEQLDIPIDLDQLNRWGRVINMVNNSASSWDTSSIQGVAGTAYRILFEKSDKSSPILGRILNSCALFPANLAYFLYTESNSFDIFKQFPMQTHTICIHSLNTDIDTQSSKEKAYLWNYVYSKNFADQVNTELNSDLAGTIGMDTLQINYINQTFKLNTKIRSIFKNILTERSRQLEFLTSVVCTATNILKSENFNKRLTNKTQKIIYYFEKTLETSFPEEYSVYKTITSLGMTPKVSDIIYSVESINAVQLPELGLFK